MPVSRIVPNAAVVSKEGIGIAQAVFLAPFVSDRQFPKLLIRPSSSNVRDVAASSELHSCLHLIELVRV